MSDSLTDPQPQTITFDEIPAGIRDPDTRVEIRPNYGNVGLLGFPTKAVVLSQMTAGGAAVPGVLYPIVANGQGGALFGRGSVAAKQIAIFRKNNTTTPLFAAAVPDAVGGAKASTIFAFGAVTFAAPWSMTVKIAGDPVSITLPAGLAQADAANALVAAIAVLPDLAVTAAVAVGAAGNVVITAKNAGFCGNGINVRVIYRSDAALPVLTLQASAGAAGTAANLAGGIGNSDIMPLLAAVGGQWFTDVITPWTDPTNRAEMAAEGVRRYGAMVNLDARFWCGLGGSYATLANYGDAGNSIQMITVGMRNPYEPDWMWAAAWGAVHAFRLANDPSRQSRGIAVVGLTAPDPVDQWSPQERELLLNNGVSTWTALPDGTVVIGRTITGYLQSNLGVADAAWLDVMTPAVMTRLRYDWRGYTKLVYPQAKLFDDDSIGAEYDDTAVTPKRMRGTWAKRCLDYERAGWIENTADTIQKGGPSAFMRNPSDKNRLDMDTVVQVAGNLMILADVLEFAA